MRTWSEPRWHKLQGRGELPRLFNSASNRIENPPLQDNKATLYVCGITPYDATHLGHAFTYLTYDLLQRAWLDADVSVTYAQNITDVDDPLLERANNTGVKWEQLAAEQIALFRSDMYQLAMLPPQHYVAVTEKIAEIAVAVNALLQAGYAYEVDAPDAIAGADIYFDYQRVEKDGVWRLGDILQLSQQEYLQIAAARGGDPERAGKRHALDPLLWRAARVNEPSWEAPFGTGRPGWHIECAVIAASALGTPFTVQGGGSDLSFPHHEFSAASAAACYKKPLSHIYSHVGMVSYKGEKMSKSLGNLVFVHKLLDAGFTGSQIRLALLENHYRSDWEWFDTDILEAKERLAYWALKFSSTSADPQRADEVITQLRLALANDLDTPLMLALINQAAETGVDKPEYFVKAVENLLGITIYETAETGMVMQDAA